MDGLLRLNIPGEFLCFGTPGGGRGGGTLGGDGINVSDEGRRCGDDMVEVISFSIVFFFKLQKSKFSKARLVHVNGQKGQKTNNTHSEIDGVSISLKYESLPLKRITTTFFGQPICFLNAT